MVAQIVNMLKWLNCALYDFYVVWILHHTHTQRFKTMLGFQALQHQGREIFRRREPVCVSLKQTMSREGFPFFQLICFSSSFIFHLVNSLLAFPFWVIPWPSRRRGEFLAPPLLSLFGSPFFPHFLPFLPPFYSKAARHPQAQTQLRPFWEAAIFMAPQVPTHQAHSGKPPPFPGSASRAPGQSRWVPLRSETREAENRLRSGR